MKQFKPLDLVPISDLISTDFKFYVPSYQRGYRWIADQVYQLIEDLEEFYYYHYKYNDKKFYCLQPLVVKERKIHKEENGENIESDALEVIDGQQRLTTILILLQALQLRKRVIEGDNPSDVKVVPNVYSIQYETREGSGLWLSKLNKIIQTSDEYQKFEQENCDYSHFAEAFKTAYNKFEEWDEDQLADFGKVLRRGTKFIWYYPTEAAGSNADIFDRLNAGKISLNNAELIKALFIQRNNWTQDNLAYSKSLSLEWDAIESRLQNKEFWGFIYRSRHPYSYDTHIEYIFDLLQRKDESRHDEKKFTFNRYMASYRQTIANNETEEKVKSEWVKQKWNEVKELFDTLNEWYDNKPIYHRIGFILEYVESEYVLSLRSKLEGKKHSERIIILDDIIKEEMSKIKGRQLFYGKAQMSEVLFLYNILLEDKRVSDTARFSFANYKEIHKNNGWDQEHVASHTDYSADKTKAKQLATDIIELIVGKKPICEEKEKEKVKVYYIDYSIYKPDGEEKELCDMALSILNEEHNQNEQKKTDEEIQEETTIYQLYSLVQKHFNTDDDVFQTITLNDEQTQKHEKDFIWNFVLLNAKTNRSYGNNIFPVKRKRILQDEYNVYTPVGTRNVFEKAYSRKSDQMFYWSKSDAKSYWEDLKSVLDPYVQLSLPFRYE